MNRGLPTVVVVDDAPEVRALVRTRLRLSGRYEVVGEGGDGEAAVALAQQHAPTVMLLDVSMPGVDGLEALPRVVAASPSTRVVVFSGFDAAGLADRAKALGAAAFVEKSTAVDRLVDELDALIGAAPSPADEPAGREDDEHARLLGEHAERFREFFDDAAIGMATLTLTGRVVRANRALARLVDVDRDVILGRGYDAVTDDPRAGLVAAAAREVVRGQADVVQLEHGVVLPSARRTVLATVAAVRDTAGAPLYLFLQAQDVTSQRRAEERLRQSEERFRLLVEAVQDYAIFMLDTEGRVASWNTGAERIKGYSADEVVGRHFRVFYPPEVQASGHPERELELALANGRYEEEGWRVRKDGSRFWANVVITALHSGGRHVGFGKVTRDVTDRRDAEERLRQSEERFRLLVEAVQDYAIFMLDPAGRVASWNTGAQRIKGYALDEVLGRHFRMFYPPEVQASGHPEHELEVALAEGHYEEEGWRVRKDGSRFWANVVITAVRDPVGTLVGFAKVTRDITERRRALTDRERAAGALATANEELAQLNARLARAADDRSEFLAVTAHELRGPVGVLGGSADLLAAHWGDLSDDERAEMLASMATSATRLRRLLGDLLTASRLEAGAVQLDRQVVRVADVAVRAAAGVRTAGGRVVVDCDPGVAVVADPDRLAQAVENLLANAFDHGAPPVVLSAAAAGDRVEIRVADSGSGVPEELLPRLFERFATGRRQGGTGLGLFIVRELARAQGGDAWYEPDAAAGRFVVSLPRA